MKMTRFISRFTSQRRSKTGNPTKNIGCSKRVYANSRILLSATLITPSSSYTEYLLH